MSLTTRRVSGSIRDTVENVLLPTHTAPSPAAIPNGRLRTMIVSGRATPGRITETVASSEFATQSVPEAERGHERVGADADRVLDASAFEVDPADGVHEPIDDPQRPTDGDADRTRPHTKPLGERDAARVDLPDERRIPARRVHVPTLVEREEADRREPADRLRRPRFARHSRDRAVAFVHDPHVLRGRRDGAGEAADADALHDLVGLRIDSHDRVRAESEVATAVHEAYARYSSRDDACGERDDEQTASA